MTPISQNMFIEKLDDIANENNNRYHRTIEMKPVDAQSNTYIDFVREGIMEDPKFEVGCHVKISKYEIIFAKGYALSWSEEDFVIKEVKNTVPRTYGYKIVGTFCQKELQKTKKSLKLKR